MHTNFNNWHSLDLLQFSDRTHITNDSLSYHVNIDNNSHNKSDFHSRHVVQQKIPSHNQDQPERS